MITIFESSEKDDTVMEINQTSSKVSFYIYYPGEESVGSRINFDRTDIRKVIIHLQNILLELHEE